MILLPACDHGFSWIIKLVLQKPVKIGLLQTTSTNVRKRPNWKTAGLLALIWITISTCLLSKTPFISKYSINMNPEFGQCACRRSNRKVWKIQEQPNTVSIIKSKLYPQDANAECD